jgi:hypothetical protein
LQVRCVNLRRVCEAKGHVILRGQVSRCTGECTGEFDRSLVRWFVLSICLNLSFFTGWPYNVIMTLFCVCKFLTLNWVFLCNILLPQYVDIYPANFLCSILPAKSLYPMFPPNSFVNTTPSVFSPFISWICLITIKLVVLPR